uniref:ATP synthase complex subunit 8 n=1 Tax=Crepidodera pluta TaxID=715800 RepID=A0A343C2G8_9CUCU|nr:ATP synthase F0 subunit 8 [Crepidodera pluta]
MPQMMPLNWLSLMLFFIMIFYLYNNLNFYSFLYMNKKMKFTKKESKFNWKW